jgi:hypothetical protein
MIHQVVPVRHKSRNPADETVAVQDRTYNSSHVLTGTSNFTALVRHQSADIVYTTKPRKQRSKSNLCRQQVIDVPSVGKYILSGSLSSGGFYEIESWSNFSAQYPTVLSAFDTYLVKAGYSVLGSDGQGYINDAFAKFKPDLTKIALPNFLLELDDIPSLFMLWKQKLSVLRNLAGARLNWSFGWKPLVGDLESIIDVIANVRQRIIDWQKNVGLPFQESGVLSHLNASSSGTYDVGGSTVHWTGSRQGTVSAYLTFRGMPIQALFEAEKVLRAYLDALGFELNPRIIWDALPFSFVLDWFFDVGGWLQRHKYDTLELPIVLVDSCLQYKEDISVQWYADRLNDSTYTPRLRSAMYGAKRKTFHRLPIFPDQSAATADHWKMPSPNQLINLVSLALVVSK